MYRTRSLVAGLLPFIPGTAPERAALWLAKGYLHQTLGAKLPAAASALQCRKYSAAPPPPPVAAEPFLNGSNSVYVEEMYNSWLQDPKSVHAVSLFQFFLFCPFPPILVLCCHVPALPAIYTQGWFELHHNC